MKTLSLRIRGAKTELESAELDTEGMATSTAKLRDSIRSLTGVDIMVNDTTFKSTYEILREISEVWATLDDISQANVLEQLAGKRNANVVSAIVTNFSTAKRALQTAVDSEGSAVQEHAFWLDSIEAKQAQFKSSFQTLSETVMDSSLIKMTYDAGTGILGFLNELTKKLGALPGFATGLTALLSITKNIGLLQRTDGVAFADRISLFGRTFEDIGKDIGSVNGFGNKLRAIFQKPAEPALYFKPFAEKYVGYVDQLKDKGGEAAKAFSANFDSKPLKEFLSQLGVANGTILLNGERIENSADAYKAYVEWVKKSTKSSAGFVSTLKGIGAGLLSLGLNMAISLAVSALVSKIHSAITETKRLREAAYEAAEATQQEIKNVEGYQSRVLELYEKLDKKNLSEQQAYEVRSQLLQIQDEMIDKYGIEYNAVELINASYRDRLAIFKQLTKQELVDWERENHDAIGNAQDFFADVVTRNNVMAATYKIGYSGIIDSILSRNNQSANDFGLGTYNDSEGVKYYAIYGTIQERIETAEKLYNALKDVDYEEKDVLDNVLSRLSSFINSQKSKKYTENTEILEQYTQYLLATEDSLSRPYLQMQQAQSELNKALAANNGDAIREARDKFQSAYTDIVGAISKDTEGLDPAGFTSRFVNEINERIQLKLREFDFTDAYENDIDGLKDKVSSLLSGLSELEISDDVSLKAALTFSDQSDVKQYASGLQQIAEQYGYTYDELVGVLTTMGLVESRQKSLTSDSQTFSSALEPYTKASNALIKMKEDLANSSTGAFSSEFIESTFGDENVPSAIKELLERYTGDPDETKAILAKYTEWYVTAREEYLDTVSQIKGISKEEVAQIYDPDTVSLNLMAQGLSNATQALRSTLTDGNGLVSAIQKVGSGASLTSEEINNLAGSYMGLAGKFRQTSDGWTISIDVLKKLHETEIAEAKDAVRLQVEKAKQIVASVTTITDAYRSEVAAISNLAQAQAAYANLDTQKVQIGDLSVYARDIKRVGDELYVNGVDIMAAFDRMYGSNADVYKAQAWASYNAAVGAGSSYLALSETLQEIVKSFETLEGVQWSPDSIYKNGSSSSDVQSQIDDQFTKVYEALQRQKDRLENAMPSIYEPLLSKYGAAQGLRDAEQFYDALDKIVDAFYANNTAKAHQYRLEILTGRNELVQTWIQEQQHAISLLKNAQDQIQRSVIDGTGDEYARKNAADNANKRIAIYRAMQDKVHALANQARSRGMSENSSFIRDLQQQWWQFQQEINSISDEIFSNWREGQESALKYQKSSLDSLIDLIVEMIKHEKDDMVEALEDQIDAYEKIIERKKEALELAKREKEHSEKVSEINKDLAEMQSRLAALELDDSREGQLERNKLLEEMAEKQKELSDLQYDYSMTNQEEALDKELEDYRDAKNKEIDELKDFLSDTKQLTLEAMRRLQAEINGETDNLFKDLLNWNELYGDSLETEICDWWTEAIRLAKEYGSVVKANEALKEAEYNYEDKPSYNGAIYSKEEQAAIQKMYENSVKWHSASASERAAIEAENQRLASQFGWTFDPKTGKWYDRNGRWIYEGLPDVNGNTSGYNGMSEDDAILKMYNNSVKWKTANNELRTQLQKENEEIARQFGFTFDPKTGKWYRKDGRWIYEGLPSFHTGGVVGGGTRKQNEVLAVLEKKEIVLDQNKQRRLMEAVTGYAPVSSMLTRLSGLPALARAKSSRMEPAVEIHAPLHVYGNMDASMKDFVKQYPRFIANEVAKVLL